MTRWLIFLVLIIVAPASAASPYADWAAVVVAGDSYSSEGERTAVFDNGRIAIGEALLKIGFLSEHIRHFSDRPKTFPIGAPSPSTPSRIARGLAQVAKAAKGGCLVYFTSHGDEQAIGIGDYGLSPKGLAKMLAQSCGARPVVAIVSACYSGVFVPKLKGPDRIVMTAAAPDRSSFGCGADDKYTFFDECVLESFSSARDFPGLGQQAVACVAAREKKEKVETPSHPQLAVGERAAALIPKWK
ncbi:hypothetical protein FHS83_002591 [Rhizomicrobium palustre]|uniref:Peptidase C13 n=1 Tax=Rhizomicrobium palustre TaxID=189966 RepID=A0A846N126_9PROT|nr:C13 family peptidase [Rhizomicrobium palustre]NIK89273.1 hypothetical protein [Rhizomicrobium palustre]